MTEFIPIKPETRIELSHDGNHNVWFDYPEEPKVASIMSGQITSKAVLTPEGVCIVQQVRKNNVPLAIEEAPFIVGDEGQLRKISSVTTLLRSVNAVEKRISANYGDPLLGWEAVRVFDRLRPVFTRHKLSLIIPYGGSDTALYLPFIEGETVKHLFVHNMTEVQAEQVSSALKARTLPLHNDVYTELTQFLNEMGFNIDREGDQLLGAHTIFKGNGRTVRATVDLHPTRYSDYDKYRNWMLPVKAIKESRMLLEQNRTEKAVDHIIENMISIDPFFIRGPEKPL